MTETTSSCENQLKAKNETELVNLEKLNKSVELKLSMYDRQNSVNETRENGDLSTSTSPGKPVYSRQPSQRPLFDEMAKNNSTTVDLSTINSTDSVYSVEKENGGNRRTSCCCVVQAFSFMITILTLGLVLFLFYKIHNSDVHELPEVIIEQSNQVLEKDDSISGSFKLNQHYLLDHTEIRWMADEHSTIVPSADEPCLVVPEDGKYQIFSRFTFRIPPGESKTLLTHNLALKTKTESGDFEEKAFKRQYVSIIEHKLNEDSELRKPSVFIQFFDMQAGDKVCTGVSNPELLYKSSIDNDVNIIKN